MEVVLSPNVTVKEGDTFPFMYFPSIEGAFEVAANGAVAVNADLGARYSRFNDGMGKGSMFWLNARFVLLHVLNYAFFLSLGR